MRIKDLIKPVSYVLVPVIFMTSIPGYALAAGNGSSGSSQTSGGLSAYENSYDAFLTELKLTVDEVARTNKKLGGELESSEDIKKRMKVLKLLSGKVSVLAKDLKTVSNVTEVLSAVPQIRKPVKYLNKSVSKVEKKMKTLDKKIKPYYKKMTTVQQRILIQGMAYRYKVVKLVRKLKSTFNQSTIDKAKQMDDYIRAAAECADIEKDLSDISSMLDGLTADMAKFRQALQKINDASVEIESILKEIKLALEPFVTLKVQLDVLDKLLAKIREYLRKIQEAFNKSFKIEFKKKFQWIGMVKFNVSFKIGEILKGPAFLFKLLERKLGEFLFKIAKAIGLKKIIQKFIDMVEKFFRDLLKKCDLSFDPEFSIKGLDKIMVTLENLFKKLEGLIEMPDIDLSYDPDFSVYLGYLPKFKKLAVCKQIKEVDLQASDLEIGGEAVRGVETVVKLNVSNLQDKDVISLLDSVEGFDTSKYDHKATVTIETDAGYQYESEEMLFKAGETRAVELPWTPQDSGDVSLTVTVSITDGTEKNVDNNYLTRTVAVLAPTVDVELKNMDIGEELTEETPVSIEVSFASISGDNTAYVKVGLAIDDGTTLESDEVVLDPSSEDLVSFEWVPAKSGEYHITASAGITNELRDTNEDNNVMTQTVRVGRSGTDHVIEKFVAEEQVFAGKETELKVVVKNNGPKASDDTAVLRIKGDDGFFDEQAVRLDAGAGQEFTCQWTPADDGAVQFDISVVSDVEDTVPGDEQTLETVDVLTPEGKILYEEELEKILSGILEDFEMPQDLEGALALIRDLIEKIKRDYSSGNLNSLMAAFSQQYPDYVRLMNALQNDFQFFRNFNIDYRIDSIDLSEDEQTAFASVLWKVRFMLPTGRFYYKEQNISMRFKLVGENWQVDGMTNNNIFGASLLAMLDMRVDLSGINLNVVGSNIIVSGIRVMNNGSARSESFRLGAVYRRSGGQTYRAYATVPAVRPGSSAYVSVTIPIVAFVPAAGDTLRVELDPDKTLIEIKTDNNIATENFPF